MNKGDKQQAGRKDMPRDRSGREGMGKAGEQRSRQQEARNVGSREQNGWDSDMDREGGRKPPAERDRDYDPDGDRTGKGGSDDQMNR